MANADSGSLYQIESCCRLYPGSTLVPFFDLGAQPPANALADSPDTPLPLVPLTLAWSEQARCPQLTATVDPAVLFRHYVWVSGTSAVARDYSEIFCERLISRMPSDVSRSVLEVASNDGTFLRPFLARKYQVLGVDPARNIAEQAEESGIRTIPEFFDRQLGKRLLEERGPFGAVFARNVLPHTPTARDLVSTLVATLDARGVGAIEFHDSREIVQGLHYDSIYHEHYFYFSLQSVSRLIEDAGAHPFDVENSPISGGSKVLFFSRQRRPRTDSLTQELAAEAAEGLDTLGRWREFADQSRSHAKALRTLVEAEVSNDRRVVGFGASARSSTMLNFAKIDRRLLAAVADNNRLKHGRYTAGTFIPILPPSEVFSQRVDTVVLLAWNFRDELLRELRERYQFSGRIIVPLPGMPEVVELKP
ncbi:MAG: methyltransferase domain-containing protein [Bdellovibrionales bacterium]|nr:methyltransferase domain-containing protein [Bdellovibrionales bacterium]